jgi:hypothetical protein
MRRHWPLQTVIVAAFAAGLVGAAKADVIDGNWCDGGGRHFTIKGPIIVTTGGVTTEGSYSRHAFSYTIPAPDPAAGAQVFMVLLNEMTVRLKVGADPSAPVEIWKRCDVTSWWRGIRPSMLATIVTYPRAAP